MRKFEVIEKPLESAKLTVATDRTTLKLPTDMSATEKSEVEALARQIDTELPTVQFTLRGRFWNRKITLSDKSNSIEAKTWSY